VKEENQMDKEYHLYLYPPDYVVIKKDKKKIIVKKVEVR
jgi:hypothetical protein